jgi:hypothetical protein
MGALLHQQGPDSNTYLLSLYLGPSRQGMIAQRAVRTTTDHLFRRSRRLGMMCLGIVLLRAKAVFSDRPPACLLKHADPYIVSSRYQNCVHINSQFPIVGTKQSRKLSKGRVGSAILNSIASMTSSLPAQPYTHHVMQPPLY